MLVVAAPGVNLTGESSLDVDAAVHAGEASRVGAGGPGNPVLRLGFLGSIDL